MIVLLRKRATWKIEYPKLNTATATELQHSVSFLSDQYDSVVVADSKQMKQVENKVDLVNVENNLIKSNLEELKQINSQLKEDLLDITMRVNLLFTNIAHTRDEDTEAVVSNFIETHLKLCDIPFEREHRLRSRVDKQSRPSPIVAKLRFSNNERLFGDLVVFSQAPI